LSAIVQNPCGESLRWADQLELRLAKARGQVDQITPSLPPSHGYGGTGLARAFAGKLVPKTHRRTGIEASVARFAKLNGPAVSLGP